MRAKPRTPDARMGNTRRVTVDRARLSLRCQFSCALHRPARTSVEWSLGPRNGGGSYANREMYPGMKEILGRPAAEIPTQA